jgi:hypothetical protein
MVFQYIPKHQMHASKGTFVQGVSNLENKKNLCQDE